MPNVIPSTLTYPVISFYMMDGIKVAVDQYGIRHLQSVAGRICGDLLPIFVQERFASVIEQVKKDKVTLRGYIWNHEISNQQMQDTLQTGDNVEDWGMFIYDFRQKGSDDGFKARIDLCEAWCEATQHEHLYAIDTMELETPKMVTQMYDQIRDAGHPGIDLYSLEGKHLGHLRQAEMHATS